ncbi:MULTISPECIES: AMP-binding protein [Psychrobacter]|uniref:AMP-binding protein n=1 Tax=Psychrobacter TaxID=497 RepID=UPI001067485B|nr:MULTISPECIES: AMP-binding protein [Psychrobacter]TEW87467.1 long-chain fatty acid--CoA ligase [Psychrobacter sp. 230]|tara:strand:+ start:198 stop:1919 length:1722 start_codon:yes stop_codon:yes gene_type:complete
MSTSTSSNTAPLWQATYDQYGLDNHLDVLEGKHNLIDLLQPKIEQHSEFLAFSMGAASLTFRQLDIASRRFATFLQAQGVEKGDRIAVQLPNILQYAVVLLGCLRAGVVLVNVNPMYTQYELAHQLTDAQACGLIVLDGMSTAYEQLDDTVKAQLKWVVRCSIDPSIADNDIALLSQIGSEQPADTDEQTHASSESSNESSQHNIMFAYIMQAYDAKAFKAVTIEREDLALLQYTGGTTGKPKGAMLTHYNVMANVCQCYAMFGKTIEANRSEQIKILNPLPLYHIFSFTVCGLLGLYGGWEDILVTNPRDIDGLVNTIEQHGPHIIPSVNTLFIGMLHHPKFASLDFSRLALSIGGGTAIIKAVSDQWQQVTGMIISEGYGMSETAPVISFNPSGITEFNGSVGLPLALTDIHIIDENGNTCPTGTKGEVCIKGPQVMRGYWQRDNADTFTPNGYFRSGDIGVMNDEGFLTLVDRKKDMILVSGFNVYPNEVEASLTEHPKVLEVAVIGVADDYSGEVPKAFVVKKDANLTVEELQDFASKRLTGYKRPQSYEFIDELPKTAVGKILRKSLR